MFRNSAGDDPIDQLKFAADQGFTAWEENGIAGYSVADQERIAKTMADLGMAMGVFVVNLHTAWTPNLSTGKEEAYAEFERECQAAVEVAKRVNAKWMTVVPGMLDPKLDIYYQTANVIEGLKRGAKIFEPHGLVMVIEPLNPYVDHPGMFLTKISQAFLVCKGVDSPACKILFDVYHQAITEGNIIKNIDLAWDEIGYFQVGDHPGRNEPTTGEVNFRRIFEHIHRKGFTGLVGMEHGISQSGKEGEMALIDAYRWSDAF